MRLSPKIKLLYYDTSGNIGVMASHRYLRKNYEKFHISKTCKISPISLEFV